MTRCFGLHNPELAFPLPHLSLKKLVLPRAIKREGHEVEVTLTIESLHPRESLIKAVFPRDFIASWKVVNLLEPSKVVIHVRLDDLGTPNHHDSVVVQEVAVLGVCYLLEIRW